MARCAKLTLEFPDGAPVRISGYRDDDSPFVLISADQPDSELIFAILQKIGLVVADEKKSEMFRYTWFVNRPYENKFVGEAAYKIRRTIRQTFTREHRADLWALCIYVQMPCSAQLVQFLRRHPEEMKLMPFIWYVTLKAPITGRFLTCFRILCCLFAAKFSRKES